MSLTNRAAAAYAVFRALDIAGSPISVAQAEKIVVDMELVLPAAIGKILDRRWSKRGRRQSPRLKQGKEQCDS